MKHHYIENGKTLNVLTDKCTGCGMCIEVCPHNVFLLNGKKAVIQDRASCMECGACKMNCPAKAIEVESGVGCAGAIIRGLIKGTAPECGCSGEKGASSCCG